MAVTQHGTKIVWGIPKEIKPLLNTFPGRIRFRFRPGSWGKVYFKTDESIRCFILEDCGDHWVPKFEREANIKGGWTKRIIPLGLSIKEG